jgi:hypothetical protein
MLTDLKSGSLNLLQVCEPVKVCNGIALPLPLNNIFYPLVNYAQWVMKMYDGQKA